MTEREKLDGDGNWGDIIAQQISETWFTECLLL
jgi:hypothetical protein